MSNTLANSLLGAAVADAASLGLHWIYDVARIADIAKAHQGPAFVPVQAAHFEGVPAYFAHGERQRGMLSQYGETHRLSIQSVLASHGQLKVADFQKRYATFFGAGGAYRGYIDRPTAGTLQNIAREQLEPSGIDDAQLPALSKLPAVIAAHRRDDALADVIEAATRITNHNDSAVQYAQVLAQLLSAIYKGIALSVALQQAADAAAAEIQGPLQAALSSSETSAVEYGAVTERACHLSMGVPLCFFILARATSFQQAVEDNILAGGDSAGRAIVIGSVLGAVYGRDENVGMPLAWVLALSEGEAIWKECQQLEALIG